MLNTYASRILIFLLLFFPKTSVKAEYAVVSPRYEVGMFSVFLTVLGFLDWYENGKFQGLKIDLEDRGFYYDPELGPNWWNYYFMPIQLGNVNDPQMRKYDYTTCVYAAYHAINDLDRLTAFNLIEKYIVIKPEIEKEIIQFKKENFDSHFMIGVHFRGTDKVTSTEARFVSYEEMVKVTQEEIAKCQVVNFKIFVATDDFNFLTFIQKIFPDKVVYQNCRRSKDHTPIHYNGTQIIPFRVSDTYQLGKEAVIDAALLSRCHLLIRTKSNLSLCSSFLDPSIEVVLVD